MVNISARALLILGAMGFNSIASAAPAPPKKYYVVCTCKNRGPNGGLVLTNFSGIVNSSEEGILNTQHSNAPLRYFPDSYLSPHQFIAGNPNGYSGTTGAQQAADAAASINKFSTAGDPAFNLDNAPMCNGIAQKMQGAPGVIIDQYLQQCDNIFTTSRSQCVSAFANDATLYVSYSQRTSRVLCKERIFSHIDQIERTNGYGGECGFIEQSASDPCQ